MKLRIDFESGCLAQVIVICTTVVVVVFVLASVLA